MEASSEVEAPSEDKKVIPHVPSRADDLAPEDVTHFYERGMSPDEVNAFPVGTSPSAVVHAVRARGEQVVMLQNPRPVMIPQEDSKGAWGEENPDIRVKQLY